MGGLGCGRERGFRCDERSLDKLGMTGSRLGMTGARLG
jgi:hypothetical protein